MKTFLLPFSILLTILLSSLNSFSQKPEPVCDQQVIFILDTSDSVSGDDFRNLRNSVNSMANLMFDRPGFSGQIGIVQYGSRNRLTCPREAHFAEVSIPLTNDRSRFGNWPRIFGPATNNRDFDHLSGSLSFMRRENMWRDDLRLTSDQPQVIIITDAANNAANSNMDNDTTDSYFDDCRDRTMVNFGELDFLKSDLNAEVIMVNPFGAGEAAAVASVGGSYNGPVKRNDDDPQGSMTTPRKFFKYSLDIFPEGQQNIVNLALQRCYVSCSGIDPSFEFEPFCENGTQKARFKASTEMYEHSWELYETGNYGQTDGGNLVWSQSDVIEGTLEWLGQNNHYYLLHEIRYAGICVREERMVLEETFTNPEFHFEDVNGNQKNNYCDGTDIYIDGSHVVGQNYFISISRRRTGSGDEFQLYATPGSQPAGSTFPMSLTDIFFDYDPNKSFLPGYDYKIALSATNTSRCERWNTHEQEFTVIESTLTNPEFRFEDGAGNPIVEYCPGVDVYMNGENIGGQRYFISVSRRRATSGDPFQYYATPGWQDDNAVFPMNLSRIMEGYDPNKPFDSGYDYRISLSAVNRWLCQDWNTVTHDFTVIDCRRSKDTATVSASPNPAYSSSTLTIKSDGDYYGTLRVFTDAGEEVDRIQTYSNQSVNLDVSTYRTGIYFYHFVSDGLVTEMQKLIVVR